MFSYLWFRSSSRPNAPQLTFDRLVFPVTGVLLILLSRTLRSGNGPLSRTFPDENDEMLSERVRSEIETTVKDASVGSAWAELEAAVLESELIEEE